MTQPVAVRKVESKADFDTFLTFPWTLYKDDPIWVPPLLSMQRHKFDKSKNPTWQHLEGDYFTARRGEPASTQASIRVCVVRCCKIGASPNRGSIGSLIPGGSGWAAGNRLSLAPRNLGT